MLLVINEISSQQTNPTSMIENTCKMIMDYAATHPSPEIRYHAIDIRLRVDSDVAYFILHQARSRGVRYFYLRSNPTSSNITLSPQDKSSILTEYVTLKNVMFSIAETKGHTLPKW